MKNFSFARFRSVVIYLIFTNRRMLLSAAVTPFLLVLLFIVIDYMHGASLANDIGEWGLLTGLFCLCFSVFSAFCGAGMVYSSRKRKGVYSSLLVLPASNVEKFVALFVVCVLVPQVVFFVSCWLPLAITYFGHVVLLVQQLNHVVFNGFSADQLMLLFALPVCSLAAFIFCGALFSRMKFIMGVVLHLLSMGVLSYVTINAVPKYFYNDGFVCTIKIVWWSVASCTVLTIVVLTWVSYRLFCRSQAVQGRFFTI